MKIRVLACLFAILATVSSVVLSSSRNAYGGDVAPSELYINEIFLDPGGAGDDTTDEYIELRGTPSMALDNYYLIFVENEDVSDFSGQAGEIDNIFDLAGASIGENGFLTLRQKYSPYSVAPGTTDLVNDGPDVTFGPLTVNPGFGSDADSTIGASDLPTSMAGFPEGKTENGGFTAMLIHNQSGEFPTLGFDLDVGNDGLLDVETGREGWQVIDAIGIHGEAAESEFGSLYAPVNFGADAVAQPRIPEGAEYVATGWEIEYVGRWGNSTGQTAADWHASNFTDDTGSGSMGLPDWRQSFTGAHPPSDGDPTTPAPPQNPAELESSQGVPYGTPLANTLGAPNFMLGDFSGDGYLTLAEYTVWRDTLGTTATEGNEAAADHNHDFLVDEADFEVFASARIGSMLPEASLSGEGPTTVPEPSSYVFVFISAFVAAGVRARSGSAAIK